MTVKSPVELIHFPACLSTLIFRCYRNSLAVTKWACTGALLFGIFANEVAASQATKADQWLDIIRKSPYEITKDFYRNIKDIRRWVLLEKGFCEDRQRHILFNRRGYFLGYVNNLENAQQTQIRLNQRRQQLATRGKTRFWAEGHRNATGYPFALACNQPHVQMQAALERMTGKQPEDRIWGSWDGIKVGSSAAPVPLLEAVLQIYRVRNQSYQFDDHILRDLLGQILIESGARKYIRSSADAVGMLQLLPAVISDCQIPQRFASHRMAQIDCALKLYRQNDRNLRPVYNQRFGHLPTAKKSKLYAMLLVQAYHGGIGRISALIKTEEDQKATGESHDSGTDDTSDVNGSNLQKAGQHFASNHHRYNAEEIALGLIFHNLGRNNLGLASLYYLVDVEIASDALCELSAIKDQSFCRS